MCWCVHLFDSYGVVACSLSCMWQACAMQEGNPCHALLGSCAEPKKWCMQAYCWSTSIVWLQVVWALDCFFSTIGSTAASHCCAGSDSGSSQHHLSLAHLTIPSPTVKMVLANASQHTAKVHCTNYSFSLTDTAASASAIFLQQVVSSMSYSTHLMLPRWEVTPVQHRLISLNATLSAQLRAPMAW
jgi:hypothetical protein